ncbi:MAG TPA: FAD-binding oxidoreductase [Solirubrobacteraceae bacterium]|nr:FAD-binding oxidoreductase [Solirubrobacteraceae bacterium]
MAASLTGWGGGQRVPVQVARPDDLMQLRAALAQGAPAGMIARGMGRSYGDAALVRAGLVLDTTALRWLSLDAERGVVRAGAGVTIGQLLPALERAGWVLQVVPGTQHVTVGGAIACDIHGKNHALAGSFGAHVLELDLLDSAGELRTLSRERDRDAFEATIGGMGLTGVIVSAALSLRRLPGPWLAVDTDRVSSLDEALDVLCGPGGPHRVAWLDLLARRGARGVVTRAEHVIGSPGEAGARRACTTVRARLRIPPRWPGGLLSPAVVAAHNELRFRRAPRHARGRLEPFGSHMFPLDVLDAWPRLYGADGLVQYQLVVPWGSERTLEAVIERVRRSGIPCYLAVLKDFGTAAAAPLSFPIRGFTLAMDLPAAAPGLSGLLDSLDELVAQAGGRVYLAKDRHVRAQTLAAMYPALARWRAVRDRLDPKRLWRSDLGVRAGLVEPVR